MSDMKKTEFGQMNFPDKILVSKKALMISNIIAIICFLYDAYIVFRYSDLPSAFSLACVSVFIISLICMIYCSQAYKENAVKTIIGFILGVIFIYDLRFFDNNCFGFSTSELVIGAIKIALGLALIVLYCLVRAGKRNNYRLIIFVRIALFILAVFVILNNMPYFINDFNGILHWFMQDVAETLAFICTYFSVACAISAIDRYKLIRDYYVNLGKWTEELGEETRKELFEK